MVNKIKQKKIKKRINKTTLWNKEHTEHKQHKDKKKINKKLLLITKEINNVISSDPYIKECHQGFITYISVNFYLRSYGTDNKFESSIEQIFASFSLVSPSCSINWWENDNIFTINILISNIVNRWQSL